MSVPFAVDHRKLAANSRFADLAAKLDSLGPIDSNVAFNCYCQTACKLWPTESSGTETSAFFNELLAQIENRETGTIFTSWGGVVITLHEPPRVEKFLVVRRGGYLALEKHAEKDENLEIREGSGLFLFRETPGASLLAHPLSAGDTFHLAPGMEHCLIGTENLLVFERSTDPKGMDQDLIFIYEPDVPTPHEP